MYQLFSALIPLCLSQVSSVRKMHVDKPMYYHLLISIVTYEFKRILSYQKNLVVSQNKQIIKYNNEIKAVILLSRDPVKKTKSLPFSFDRCHGVKCACSKKKVTDPQRHTCINPVTILRVVVFLDGNFDNSSGIIITVFLAATLDFTIFNPASKFIRHATTEYLCAFAKFPTYTAFAVDSNSRGVDEREDAAAVSILCVAPTMCFLDLFITYFQGGLHSHA